MAAAAVKEINIAELLKEKFIELDLPARDKKEAITQLVEVAAKSPKLTNKKAFLKGILDREVLGSTGIGNGVAIPHAKTKVAADFVLVFGRSAQGLDFGALDGEKTYLFFALASPLEKVGMHLKILSEISHMMKDKFIVERLRHAKDKKEIITILATLKRTR